MPQRAFFAMQITYLPLTWHGAEQADCRRRNAVGNIFKSKREFLRVMLATLDKLLIANTKKCGMQVARDRVLIEMGIHPNGGMFWQDTSRRSVGPSFLF